MIIHAKHVCIYVIKIIWAILVIANVIIYLLLISLSTCSLIYLLILVGGALFILNSKDM